VGTVALVGVIRKAALAANAFIHLSRSSPHACP
jgi:hypothetical protein